MTFKGTMSLRRRPRPAVKPEHILTRHAPAPIGPYSQAIQAGDELYCSGQIPLDPQTGELVDGDVAAQTERVIEISKRCSARPEHFADVVKTTLFLDRHERLRRGQRRLRAYFGATKPARSTVAVAGFRAARASKSTASPER